MVIVMYTILVINMSIYVESLLFNYIPVYAKAGNRVEVNQSFSYICMTTIDAQLPLSSL